MHAREIVLLAYRFVQARGIVIDNPAEAIRPSAIARFKVRDRALSPAEIHVFFRALDEVATLPTLRLAVKFMLLTLVRKSEFIQATWPEIDFASALWSIPKERMNERLFGRFSEGDDLWEFPRWPGQTAPLVATETAPGRTRELCGV